jgi:FAD/FMN-containing dehydrogenase
MVPVGTNGDTGVAGLTLSGGNGFFSKKFGATIDSLEAVDVVGHDGSVHTNVRWPADGDNTADATFARELLWAFRGSGGHFGVVTKFVFRTHPLPNDGNVLFGQVVTLAPTIAQRVQIVKNYFKLSTAMTDDSYGVLVLPAGAPVVPTIWINTSADAPKGLAACEELAPATRLGGLFNVVNKWEVARYEKVQCAIAAEQAHGFLYQTAVVLRVIDDATVTHLVESIAAAPARSVFIVMPNVGVYKTTDPGCVKCSYGMRHTAAWVLVESRYDPEVDGPVAGRERCAAWCRSFVQGMKDKFPDAVQHTSHAFSDGDTDVSAGGNNVSHDTSNVKLMERLRAAKARFDPENLFSHNRSL